MGKTKIQINYCQLKELNDLKQNLKNGGTHEQVLDVLLKNQKRVKRLENIIKMVNLKTRL